VIAAVTGGVEVVTATTDVVGALSMRMLSRVSASSVLMTAKEMAKVVAVVVVAIMMERALTHVVAHEDRRCLLIVMQDYT
jgi:hypothetical protein